jgi:hypothetical protein
MGRADFVGGLGSEKQRNFMKTKKNSVGYREILGGQTDGGLYPRLNHPVITNVRFAILEAQSMQFAKLKSGFRRTLESGSITNQQKNG